MLHFKEAKMAALWVSVVTLTCVGVGTSRGQDKAKVTFQIEGLSLGEGDAAKVWRGASVELRTKGCDCDKKCPLDEKCLCCVALHSTIDSFVGGKASVGPVEVEPGEYSARVISGSKFRDLSTAGSSAKHILITPSTKAMSLTAK